MSRRCKPRLQRAGLEGRVRLVGHVEDIAAACLAAHVAVVASTSRRHSAVPPSRPRPWAAPVIATAIGAPPETVLAEPAVPPDAITGWLVPPGDAGALAERLAQALALPAPERAALAGRARAHVVAQFTVEAMQRRTLAVYDRLLGTVLERRFQVPRLPGKFQRPCSLDNLDLRYHLSDSLAPSAVPALAGGALHPCNNRWRLQHTSSNASRA